jgi:hypothetical protein
MHSRLLRFWVVLVALLSAGHLSGTTVAPPEFAELVNGADYVVRARVVGIRHEVRTIGTKPTPFTLVELEVREVICGKPPSPLVLTILGGPIDETELVISGAPRFALGDEDILFIADNGRSIFPLYGLMHGRYPIQRDASSGREYVTRVNGEPLDDTSRVSLPLIDTAILNTVRSSARRNQGMSPPDFANRIQASRKPISSK